ncbi:MAG: glutamine synthetase family protein [Actinomycetota bacterium]|nr:glutamine synthetase family protein [Actinomycetota bacterium]
MVARDRTAQVTRAKEIATKLQRKDVHGLVLSYLDAAGINRIKAIPMSRLARATEWGVGMSPVFDAFLADDSITSTGEFGGPDGDLRLFPDLEQIVVLAGQPGWAWAPVDRYTQDGEPHAACQRTFARTMTERAAEAGLTLQMAFEIEWAVGAGDTDDFVPACTGPAYGMTRLVELSDYARDILVALEQEGTEVDQLHPEYAAGQFEVSVGATDPVTAADRSVLVRQTIRAITARHGLRVSFAPSVVAGSVGNGGHVHLSAWRDRKNAFAGGEGRYGITAEGEAFAGGILADLPALCAIGAPTVASYLRLVPSHWAGVYAAWGRENREAALRFVTGMVGSEAQAANLEVKCFDLAASPYLVVGTLIAAGLQGIQTQATLPAEVTGDPARFTGDELADQGISRLPQSLDDATAQLAASYHLREAMGKPLADAVLAVRRGEAERFRDTAPEDVVAALRWVY